MTIPLANVLQPLIDVANSILEFWHDSAGLSWGASIIMLTVCVRLAILPLTFKQVRSMQELQRLQPEMKRLQERYKGDRQRLNQEMMKLYQEHKVNPLGSCLPILLQLPFFISLFYMLRKDLRLDICGQSAVPCGEYKGGGYGEEFLFIPDLTDKATGAGVLILPGGGYQMLTVPGEGADPARFFLSRNVAAFVLRYRHGPRYHYPTTLLDAQRALRLIRARAQEHRVDRHGPRAWRSRRGRRTPRRARAQRAPRWA